MELKIEHLDVEDIVLAAICSITTVNAGLPIMEFKTCIDV